jgi:hypothetical protein
MFENLQIAADDLPQVETVEWQRMDPKFRSRQLAGALVTIVIIAVGAGILNFFLAFAAQGSDPDFSAGWLWVSFAGLALLLAAWPFLSVPRMRYAVRERDIVYRHGVVWHTVTAVPFNRIQHVEKSSTPLDRRFQVASLQLYTAGGSSSDLKIRGLPARSAEKLRMFILDKIGGGIEHS